VRLICCNIANGTFENPILHRAQYVSRRGDELCFGESSCCRNDDADEQRGQHNRCCCCCCCCCCRHRSGKLFCIMLPYERNLQSQRAARMDLCYMLFSSSSFDIHSSDSFAAGIDTYKMDFSNIFVAAQQQQPPPQPMQLVTSLPPPVLRRSSSQANRPLVAAAKLKKAPDAPKRFKSAFIIFSAEKHKQIKASKTAEGITEKVSSSA
jgi:hypothetical protein